MKRLIHIRKRHPALGRGSLEFVRHRNDKVLAHLRQHGGETLLLVHNLADSSQAAELDLAKLQGSVPVELFGESRFPQIGDRPYMLSLGPYGRYWFKLHAPGDVQPAYGIEGHVL
jgi:maltose alpha-D-glucosyltransferase/alpha-amylase